MPAQPKRHAPFVGLRRAARVPTRRSRSKSGAMTIDLIPGLNSRGSRTAPILASLLLVARYPRPRAGKAREQGHVSTFAGTR